MTILKGRAIYLKDGKLLEEVLWEEEGEDRKPKGKVSVQNKLFRFGGPGSGDFGHSGRPEKEDESDKDENG